MAQSKRGAVTGFLLVCVLALPQTLDAQTSSSATKSPETLVRAKLSEGIAAKVNAASIASLADAEAVVKAFNAFLGERTGHSLSDATILRLALAEWGARLQDQGTIPIDRLAELVTRLFLEALGGPGTTAPATIGTPYYVITPEKLNGARLLYRRLAREVTGSHLPYNPGDLGAESTVPAVKKAFPLEALIALYVCVSGDLGYGGSALQERWEKTAASTSPSGWPFGDHGRLVRRPISKLLTDEVVNRILDLAS